MRPSFFRAIHYIFPTLSKKKGRLDLSLYDLPLEPAIIFPKESRPVEDDSALSVAQKKRQSELPSSTKKLNRLLGSQHVGKVVLQEGDLQEKFVRGSGNGGQAINKLSTCVDLIHLPTGLRVQAQPTRSLQTNREIARKLMAEKLATLNTDSELPSRQEILAAKRKLKKSRAEKRSRRKYAGLKEKESPVGLIEDQTSETS